MPTQIASPLETGADPNVVALQRAENYAPVLLASPDWNLRAHSAAAEALQQADNAAKRAWLADATRPKPAAPEPCSDADFMRRLGYQLARDSFALARGYAAGEHQILSAIAESSS